ncbi:aldose epimerase family protein [Clostridium intestinale]|uniref:Aldose 1-epimerase n=1 Tax=Clostridium intestinale DSM 6191 TaxID=1121320 RepID=A0A1M5ZK78_9CLOT|nr:aldose epimerase family protein [Clostridium intestinale]SHI24640.1 aldose 1-epimerase [Clostridium intestinale DSM 6191]
MGIRRELFGKLMNEVEVDIFTLTNSKGMEVKITNLGGAIVSLKVPDPKGKLDDVVLGYDTPQKYLEKGPYLGAIIGRCANRIEEGIFEINNIEYKLQKNSRHHLHGGNRGFDKVLWQPELVNLGDGQALKLSYLSKDGEEGYPGNLDVNVIYSVSEDNELRIDYRAVTDKDTVVNLTNHSYFNLSGHSSGSVLEHKVMINASSFTPSNNESIPTGEILRVDGTPMDLRKLTTVKDKIFSDYEQLNFANGFDHNWVLDANTEEPEKAGAVVDEKSGRVMEVYTTKPGVQFYTGNFLAGGPTGKDGVTYENRDGLCLETQFFPNAVRCSSFPSPILKVGEEYKHTTIYKFSVI